MTCFGVDPGLGLLGWGIVRQEGDLLRALDYGAISTKPEEPITRRLGALHRELAEKIRRYAPDVMAVERLYFGRNVTTAEMVYQARGVVLLLASQAGFDPYEPKPAEVKMAVCGNGAAEKSQVQGMVKRLLGLEEIPRPDDAADALAIAIAGLSMAAYDRSNSRGAVR